MFLKYTEINGAEKGLSYSASAVWVLSELKLQTSAVSAGSRFPKSLEIMLCAISSSCLVDINISFCLLHTVYYE